MEKLSIVFVEAASQGVSCSINELLSCTDLAEVRDDPLELIRYIKEEANRHKIEMSPDPAKIDNWDMPIIFTRLSKKNPDDVGATAKKMFISGERPDLELKSSLWMDIKRALYDKGISLDQLKSSAVCNSAMKSLCGFLNEEGGTLIIGVANDLSIVGLQEEFSVVSPKDPTIDGWLLGARDSVSQFFHEFEEVRHHIKIEIGSLDGKYIAIFTVIPRKKLSLCKCSNLKDFKVYTRRGTSTEEVTITSLEAYIRNRS